MRLEQLFYCLEVANSKSMSQASKKLFITQSTLSTAVQNLEEEVGFQIFKRSCQGVSVTSKGEELLKRAEIIAAQLDEIRNLSLSDENIPCQLNLAAVPVVCNTVTIELLKAIKKSRDNIGMRVMELRPNAVIDALIQGKADIVVGSYSEYNKGAIYNEAAKYNLVVEPLYEDVMYAYLGRTHPKARQACITMEELQEDTQVVFIEGALMEADEHSQRCNYLSKNHYAFSDKSGIKKTIASGLAYAILPRSMAYQDVYISSGLIRALPIADVDATITIYVAYKDHENRPAEQKMAIDLLRQIYQKMDDELGLPSKKSDCSGVNNNILVY